MICKRINFERNAKIKSGFILPVLDMPVTIMQGYNGPWSHGALEMTTEIKGKKYVSVNDDSYSLDFQVPFGTQVIAPASGKIYLISSKKFYDGTDFEIGIRTPSSFAMIEHKDCISICSHLGRFDSGVISGEKVLQGQHIGVTGKSGWVGPRPHLHFEVCDKVSNTRMSCPVKFDDYSGSLEHSLLVA